MYSKEDNSSSKERNGDSTREVLLMEIVEDMENKDLEEKDIGVILSRKNHLMRKQF